MAIAKLSIDIEARLAGLQEGMDKAAVLSENSAQRINKAFDGVRLAAGAISGVLAGALAGFSFANLVKSSIDAADHLRDLSSATGVSVEELGGLGFAASQAGSDLDGVAAAVGKLNLTIAKGLAGDKEAAGLFDSMGVSIKDAAGQAKTADVIFGELATKFASYNEGPEKAALANAAFGKSYASVLPLLNDGGIALRENIEYYKRFSGVTTETALAADQFNDTMGRLQLVSGSAGRQLAVELLPTLQAIAEALTRSSENAGVFTLTAKGIGEVFKVITVLGANVAFVLESVYKEVDAIGRQAVALGKLDINGFNAISEAVKRDGEKARKVLDDFERRVMGTDVTIGLNTGSGPRGARVALLDAPSLPQGRGPAQPRSSTPVITAATNEALAGALRILDQTDSAKLAKLNAELSELFKMDEMGNGSRPELSQAIANVRIELEKLDPVVVAAADAKKRLDNILSATPTGKLTSVLDDVDLINQAFDRGALSPERWAEAIHVATSRIGGADVKQQLDDISMFAQRAAENIQDALGDTVANTLSGNFENIGQLWKNLLIRMASEAIAANIGRSLFGDFAKSGVLGGLAGSGLGSLAALFSADGNAFGQGRVQAYANGGILGPLGGLLTQPTVFPMEGGIGVGGEAGTEAVMPLARGRNGKLGVQMTGGSAGGGMTNIIHVAAGVTRSEVMSAIQLGMQSVESNVYSRLRRERVL